MPTDYKISNDRAVSLTYELQPMQTCPHEVEVLLETRGGTLVRGRWDGRSKAFLSWCPFPKHSEQGKHLEDAATTQERIAA